MRFRWTFSAIALAVGVLTPSLALPRPPEDVGSLMRRAAQERKRGDYPAAVGTYREVLRLAPELFEAHLFLADTLRKHRLDDAAAEEFLAAKRIRPADPLPYAGLSELRRESFRYAEALAILDEGAAAVPAESDEPLVLSRGMILRQSGDVPAAVEVLTRGAKAHPSSHRIRGALARSLEAAGRPPEALAAWAEAENLAPDVAEIRIGLEQARANMLLLERAEAATEDPRAGPGAWKDLARICYLLREFPRAEGAARRARDRGERAVDLVLLRALALEKGGRNAEAESEFKRIPSGAPQHLLAAYHRAYLARLRGDGRAEEKIWFEAVETDPQDPALRTMLVLLWKRRGILEDRIADLRSRNSRSRTPSARRILEGMALEEAGQDRAAAQVYSNLFLAEPLGPEPADRLSALLALRPALLKEWLEGKTRRHAEVGKGTDPAPHLLLAHLLLTAGRGKAALDELREAAELYPERVEPQVLLAAVMGIVGGDPAEESRALARAADLAAGSPWVPLQAGLSLLRSGDAERAVREGDAAVGLAPALPETHQLLGLARMRAGDFPGAARELSAALALDPTDSPGVIRFQLAQVHSAMGETLEASTILEGELPPFPELIYRMAWSFVRSAFLDRSFAGQDWLAWRDRFGNRLTTPLQAYTAAAEMLASLGDPYTRLRSAEETELTYLKTRSTKLETGRSGNPTRSSRSVLVEDLGENLGYIRLTNLSDPSAREAIRRALEKMAERDGLVLDL
ncbi:MAG TPA: tetratricopeptide repeat protein, partial [Candidatus Polarisedimenticolia bacterium]|nr:tetratricopeptide repeat protein [Candidatus Polarisedimenticolia bacterium]